jgi:hypothetical protein
MTPTLRKRENMQKWKRSKITPLILGKSQEGQSIEDDLFAFFIFAFRRGFKTAIGQPDKTEWPCH